MSKEEKIEKIIQITFDSLDSHLPYTYDQQKCDNCKTKFCPCDDTKFHKKCVKEYAEVIKLASDLL